MVKQLELISSEIQRVSDLSNRPNYPLTYGGDGMSAAALKARFDALPLAVRDKVNELVAALSAHSEGMSGASCIGIAPKSYNEGRVTASSVADLIEALEDTGIAQLLMVHTGERVCSLQECLQEHARQIQEKAGIFWTVQSGTVTLFFPGGEIAEIPKLAFPRPVWGKELAVEDRVKYLLTGLDEVTVKYPCVEVISQLNQSESLGRGESEQLVFTDAYTARGNFMFCARPEQGALCSVILYDGEPLPLTASIWDSDGVAHLYLDGMEVTVTQGMEGVDVRVRTQEAHSVGEVMPIYVRAYVTFEADLRVCSGENGTVVRFPSSLYTGEVPDFAPRSVWDIHLDSGMITARRVMQEEEAAASSTVRIEQAMEVIANGAY